MSACCKRGKVMCSRESILKMSSIRTEASLLHEVTSLQLPIPYIAWINRCFLNPSSLCYTYCSFVAFIVAKYLHLITMSTTPDGHSNGQISNTSPFALPGFTLPLNFEPQIARYELGNRWERVPVQGDGRSLFANALQLRDNCQVGRVM